MNIKKLTLGIDFEKLYNEGNDYDKIKSDIISWCENNKVLNYQFGFNEQDDLTLTLYNISRTGMTFALLTIPHSSVIDVEEYPIHPDVEHLLDFGDDS